MIILDVLLKVLGIYALILFIYRARKDQYEEDRLMDVEIEKLEEEINKLEQQNIVLADELEYLKEKNKVDELAKLK